MDQIIIFGASGHAKTIASIIEKQNKYLIFGFFDNINLQNNKLGSYSIFHNFSEIKQHNIKKGIIAIGNNQFRYNFFKLVISNIPDMEFVTVIDDSAQIANDVVIGEGCIIMPLSIINCSSVVGKHCIINTRASIDHDNHLGDFTSVSPGATLGGNVCIHDFAFIGLGANVIQKITIGKNVIIGAGSTVLKNIPENVVAYGNPCRIIRQVNDFEDYL